MSEWGKCEKAVKSELGSNATPALLRRSVLSYAEERLNSENNAVSEILSVKLRWSWKRLSHAGNVIAGNSDKGNPLDCEYGIANALISLVSFYKSASRERRERQHWREWHHCRLCWRFVPLALRASQKILCGKHKSRSAEYQKHLKSEERALELYREQHALPIDAPSRHPPENPKEWLMSLYPYTYGRLIANSVDISSWVPILDFLDDDRDPFGLRTKLHESMAADRPQLVSILDWSEAWLTALSEKKHGGRRPNAGRPRKRDATRKT